MTQNATKRLYDKNAMSLWGRFQKRLALSIG